MNTIYLKSIAVVVGLIIVYFSTDIMQVIPGFDEAMPENFYIRVLLLRFLDYSPLLLVGLLFFRKGLKKILGLTHSPIRGFNVAFLFTLPMFVTFLIVYSLNNDITGREIWSQVITPAFFEELAYRGIVFGGLYYLANWKFFPAVLLNATVFGLAHLYQSTDPMNALFIFLLTFIGSIWYSWLYAKWDGNLYIPLFLHLLMNFSWLLFDVSDSAAGDAVSHIAQVVTLVFSVMYTVCFTGGKRISWEGFLVLRQAQDDLRRAHPSTGSG